MSAPLTSSDPPGHPWENETGVVTPRPLDGSPQSLESRVWEVLRTHVFHHLEQKEIHPIMSLSKRDFGEAVKALYFDFDIQQYKALCRIPIAPRRLAQYLDSVRSLSLNEYSPHLYGPSFTSYSQILEFFPNLTVLCDENATFRFNSDHGPKRATSITRGILGYYQGDEGSYDWPGGEICPLPTDWTGSRYHLTIEYGEAMGSIETDGGYCLAEIVKHDLEELAIYGSVDLSTLSIALAQRLAEGFTPIRSYHLVCAEYSFKAVNDFIHSVRNTISSLTLGSAGPCTLRLRDAWCEINWEGLRGAQDVELKMVLASPGFLRWQNDQESSMQSNRAAIRRPKKISPPLHLQSFQLNLYLPKDCLHTSTFPHLLLDTLPMASELAEFMLSIGGPLCWFNIYFRYLRLPDQPEVDVSEVDPEPYQEMLRHELQREINGLLSTPRVPKGWSKVEKV